LYTQSNSRAVLNIGLLCLAKVFYLITARGSDGSTVFNIVTKLFFPVNMITHEPLHSAWQTFARTCILTTSRSLLNAKVIG